MADREIGDLLGLSRDVALAAGALARWRAALAIDPEGQAGVDPFEGLRHVAAKSTWDRLGEVAPSAADEPLRAGLRRWVLALVQARIAGVDDLALAKEAARPSGRFEGERPRQVSWREAWRGVVEARSSAETQLWLAAAADAGPSLAPLARRRSARRIEVARRMGLAHPWEKLVAPLGLSALRTSAERVLDRTEDLSRAVWKHALGEAGGGMAALLHAVVGRDAGDGWPAHLTSRWFEDLFRAAAPGLAMDLPPLPAAIGAASFARALSTFGFALRSATAQSSMPFAIARDPAFVGAHRLGLVFGALASDPQFYLRALGLGRRAALAQARVLARTSLFEARLGAARIIVADDASPGRDVFDEVGARLFGSPADARLHGAWPAAREDEPARWLALLQAPALRREVRDRFDSDWFLNPRAWAHLRSQGAAPAHEAIEEGSVEPGVEALARGFEDALG
jgi:hypothetical protein